MRTTSVEFEAVETAINNVGLAPFRPGELSEERLYTWLISPRIPIWVSEEPFIREIIRSICRRKQTSFFYMDGSSPWQHRTISPNLVFQVEEDGPVFVSGYCHDLGENRVFRFDRMLEANVGN